MKDSPRQKAVKAARSAGVAPKLQSEDCDLGTTRLLVMSDALRDPSA
jgi:hypothetical protein